MIKKRQIVAVVPEPRNSLSFGFKDLRDISYVKAKNDSGYFVDFIQHLRKFCALNWNDIRTTQRHGLGTESIDVDSLKEGAKPLVPSGLAKLLVLRATGNNHAFLGYRDGSVFQVLFIEYNFGDIYNHG